jgi:hypothetical protein
MSSSVFWDDGTRLSADGVPIIPDGAGPREISQRRRTSRQLDDFFPDWEEEHRRNEEARRRDRDRRRDGVRC